MDQLPKVEDGTIIPPTKAEMAALIAGSVGKTGALDDEWVRDVKSYEGSVDGTKLRIIDVEGRMKSVGPSANAVGIRPALP